MPATRRMALLCGVFAPLLYAVADLVAGTRSPGYSFRDQTISELGAVAAPSQLLFSTLLIPVYLLLAVFGIAVWRSAEGRRPVQTVGGLLLALGVMALTVGQFVPMRPRGTDQGLTGMLHLVEGGAAVVMIVAAIALAATAFGKLFRVYCAATIAVVLAFGAWSAMDVAAVEAGLPTPWLGVKERVFWYAYQLWFAVLAVTLLRENVRQKA